MLTFRNLKNANGVGKRIQNWKNIILTIWNH